MPGQIVKSFVLRFLRENTPANQVEPAQKAGWRVVVRSVQSGEQQYFASVDDAFDHIRMHLGSEGKGARGMAAMEMGPMDARVAKGKAVVGDIQLYYEIHEQPGPAQTAKPLVLIEGLGYFTWMWYRQVPELSRHFRVIIFDNRGVGESDKPDVPYSIRMMADDLAGLLKELGIAKAHVLGASMGGFIAQEFALTYPEVVDRLVLLCTSPGGPRAIPMPAETVEALTSVAGLDPVATLRQMMAPALSADFPRLHADELEKIISWRLAKPQPRFAWQRQFDAVNQFNADGRLKGIKAPTLIMTGTDDRVLPAGNSQLIAEQIPGAKLVTIPGAGHLFFIERAEEVNAEILDFLQAR